MDSGCAAPSFSYHKGVVNHEGNMSPVNFDAALSFCWEYGGDLASLHSIQDAEAVRSIICIYAQQHSHGERKREACCARTETGGGAGRGERQAVESDGIVRVIVGL